MDHTDLREKLITYLHKRGWHQKLAKKRQGEETLLEHALKCFDTTHTLAQLLPDIFSSPQETSLASAAHDVGKENDSAQRALRQGKALGDHVAPHLTHSILADMSHYLELGSNVCLPDAALGVNLHHDKGNRTRVRESLIETTSAAPEVSELVKLVDRIVSASSAIQASELLRANTFSRHYLTVTYHQVRIRGVSTMLLHEACRRAHVEHGWTPLLYYPDAVLYVARREFGSNISPITPEQIREQLQRVLADFAETQSQRSGFPNLFLNNITTTFLIFSDMFDCTLTRSLLEAASYKLGYKKGIPQGQEALQDAVDTCIQKLDAQITRHKLPVKLDGPPLATARLVWSSGREIAVSKAFKLLMYGTSKAPALVDSVGARVAQEMYDGLFGTDTFERLRRTANLKREVDYMWGIYPFHQQTVAKLIQFLSVVPDTLRGLDPHVRVSALAPRKRVRLLVEILSTIAERAFDAMESPQTCGTQMARAAQVLLRDLVMPDAGHDNSWADIESVFTPGGSNRRIFACALCNSAYHRRDSTHALASLVPGRGRYTNRFETRGINDNKRMCPACYYEIVLSKFILDDAAYMAILTPRRLITPPLAEMLVTHVGQLQARADKAVDGSAFVGLAPSHELAQHFVKSDNGPLDQDLTDLLPLLVRVNPQGAEETVQSRLEHALARDFDDHERSVEQIIRDDFGLDGVTSWPGVATAVLSGQLSGPDIDVCLVRARQGRAAFRTITITPNFMGIALSQNTFGNPDKQSSTDLHLRQLFFALVYASTLDMSVAVYPTPLIGVNAPAGAARIPASIRPLFATTHPAIHRTGWVDMANLPLWLAGMAGVIALEQVGSASKRSPLLAILMTGNAGALLARIERGKLDKKINLPSVIDAIHRIKELLQWT